MEGQGYGNALTEVALALAMAFFALMILAILSISVPLAETAHDAQEEVDASRTLRIDAADIVQPSEESSATSVSGDEDIFLVYYQGTLYDQELHEVRADTLEAGTRRIVLGLPPESSLQESLSIRGSIDHANLIIAQLNSAWLARLKEMTQ